MDGGITAWNHSLRRNAMTTNNSDMEAMAICHFNMSEQKYRLKKIINTKRLNHSPEYRNFFLGG